jgi:flagellar basal-body rod protein FlgB
MNAAEHVGVSDLFKAINPLHSALDYHFERHNLLASNIAHVDTPGYVPRDIERVDGDNFASQLDVALSRTDAGHIAGNTTAAVSSGRVFEDPAAGAGNDLNYVSLDREAAKLAANQIRYDVSSTLASAELAQLAYAVNDGKGV